MKKYFPFAAIVLLLSVVACAPAANPFVQNQPASPVQPAPNPPVVNNPPTQSVQPQTRPSTGIPVQSGATLPKGSAAIVREIRWDLTPVEVWVWWTPAADRDLFVGPAFDGFSGHVRDAWTSSDRTAWNSQASEACKESQAVVAGGLGTKNVKVHFQGGAVPAVCQ